MSARKEHLGQIGDRLQVLANVYLVKIFQNKYNFTYLVLMQDDSGHTLKTYYSGRNWMPERGQRIELKATVKKHGAYQGAAETELKNSIVKVIGLAKGFDHTDHPPLPRVEEIRWEQQKKAQHDFIAAARGPTNVR